MMALLLQLVPVLIGIVASPLAIMALIAVLLSRRARRNGVLYLLGWALAVIAVLTLATLLLAEAEVGAVQHPPWWVSVLRVLFAALFAAAALWTYRRARVSLRAMALATSPEEVAAAAPQLPGWVQAVEKFTAARSLLLGVGIFLLNPVNVSCAIVAALDIQQAGLDDSGTVLVLSIFAVLCILPMAVPVALLIFAGDRAVATLRELRRWIAEHNGLISAAFLMLISFSQLQKAFDAWS